MDATAGRGRAVVLGGGGLSGVAWLTGLLSAFEAEGVSLADADLVLGTSAGSVVATQLVSGRSFSHLYHFLSSPHVPLRTALLDLYALAPKPDPQVVAEMMAHTQAGEASTVESRTAAGAAALAAEAMPEPVWVALLAAYIHHRKWPGPALGITTVEAETGRFRVIREADGVPVARACAASAAVPRFFPPVEIDGTHYIDGGTRSCTNADVAAGYGTVVVLVDHTPVKTGEGPLSRAGLERELTELRAGGVVVVEVELNAASAQAMGSGDQLNPEHLVPSAIAGRAQGVREVERVRAAWRGSVWAVMTGRATAREKAARRRPTRRSSRPCRKAAGSGSADTAAMPWGSQPRQSCARPSGPARGRACSSPCTSP